ncbi:hypothetical protein TRAPUB_12407 [Trametes pubescens]|uniref:Uncharacterized protein n=1 Tax=Trametes pubescens TaxID=154538 RepID=A0A1M2VU42_TRAPU|nr:hypothetical protein TRAPUB_12407 [Trametes pubescens]
MEELGAYPELGEGVKSESEAKWPLRRRRLEEDEEALRASSSSSASSQSGRDRRSEEADEGAGEWRRMLG